MTKVFISYTRRTPRNIQFADQLYAWLKQNGFNPWMDRQGLSVGGDWPQEIDGALKACDVVVGIASKDSVSSDPVIDEWTFAKKTKRIQLALIEDCEIPYHFSTLNYIDFTGKDPQCWNKLRDVLIEIGTESGSLPRQGMPHQQSSARPTPLQIAINKPSKSSPLGSIPMLWWLIGGGVIGVLLVIAILIAALSNGDNGNPPSDNQAQNAADFVGDFFSGNVNAALTNVCPAQRSNYQQAFTFANASLASQGISVTASSIVCRENSSTSVTCSYTLNYSTGVSQPLTVTFIMQDKRVCDPNFGS